MDLVYMHTRQLYWKWIGHCTTEFASEIEIYVHTDENLARDTICQIWARFSRNWWVEIPCNHAEPEFHGKIIVKLRIYAQFCVARTPNPSVSTESGSYLAYSISSMISMFPYIYFNPTCIFSDVVAHSFSVQLLSIHIHQIHLPLFSTKAFKHSIATFYGDLIIYW